MKLVLTAILWITLLSSSLMAEMVFDLRAQQFSNSLDGKFKDSTYDVGKSIMSTGLAYIDGSYRPKSGQIGGVQVRVKEPKPKWSITFDMYSYLYTDGFGVTLQDAEGHAINLAFMRYGIAVDGKKQKTGYYGHQTFNCSIEKEEENVKIVINGLYTFAIKKKNFNLSYINISLSGVDGGDVVDKISSLAIVASDI
jgi:hypothetical protein